MVDVEVAKEIRAAIRAGETDKVVALISYRHIEMWKFLRRRTEGGWGGRSC